MSVPLETYWSIAEADLLRQLGGTPHGLTSVEARQRLTLARASSLRPRKPSHEITLLLAQFKSPLILILLAAAGLSFFLHDPADAVIILTIHATCEALKRRRAGHLPIQLPRVSAARALASRTRFLSRRALKTRPPCTRLG